MRDDILIEIRMLSNPVPLVNIANMCQNKMAHIGSRVPKCVLNLTNFKYIRIQQN